MAGPDARPLVRTAGSGQRQVWLFGAVLLLGGVLVFQALNQSGEPLAPTTRPTHLAGGAITSPPPLSLPPWWSDPALDDQRPPPRLVRRPPPAPVAAAAPSIRTITRIVERPEPVAAPQARAPASPDFIEPAEFESPEPPEIGVDERVTAARLSNPSLTVPQGAIIVAVLETALDSSRPGSVRAIVSRDVHSFDGSRVLIPRGSRLYGAYAADVTAGQKRALIRWQRLTRPDAVIVRLDSPAADPLGRAGVRGEVDSRFFARFGSAILQSVLDIGVGIATRAASDGVVVALPGSSQTINSEQQPEPVQPSLRIKQGTSVSVFVSRDLDFSTVDF